MPSNNIHWFPGHMNKAFREVEERIKLVDVVIELLDARCPFSSINPNLENVIQNKKKVIVLSKPDLADPKQTEIWKQHLQTVFDLVLVLDLTNPASKNEIAKAVSKLGKEKQAKQIAKGMKPQPIRTMIIGVPNVGKSSLINRLANRKAAGVQNKPGFTRGEQWIKVNNDFILLDTPGILPTCYENQDLASNLALIGSIREDILPTNLLVSMLIEKLKNKYPNSLNGRYSIAEITNSDDVIRKICDIRKLVDGSGNPDVLRAETLLLKEFKDGLLGRITLEWKEN